MNILFTPISNFNFFIFATVRINTISINGIELLLYVTHGFKNRTGERTGKGSGSRITGPTGVRSVVEPMTS